MLVLIAAVSKNNVLGKNNALIWHLPNDFKRFKLLTTGHYIVMGRKTFESFPKPLPNRTHVVITRQKNYNTQGCLVADSLEKALALCPKNQTVYLIGGGEIYLQGLSFCNKLEITRVHESFEGDAFFPEINPNEWHLVASEFHAKNEQHLYDYSYETFIKKEL